MKLKVTVNGTVYDIEVEEQQEVRPTLGNLVVGGSPAAPVAGSAAPAVSASGDAVPAPLAGSVFKILVEEGQEVKAGDVLVILEAMKMETEITAPADGVVTGILVNLGDAVQAGQGLVSLGAAASGGEAKATEAPAAPTGQGTPVPAPLAGSVFKIEVAPGDKVEAGQVVIVLEAMKMETEIKAESAGTVNSVLVKVGDAVQAGQPLVEIG